MNDKIDNCWLALPDGTRLEVDSKGLLFGRGAGADVFLADARADRRHALVYVDRRGPQLVSLGEEPVQVNARRASRFRTLKHGDRVELPGMKLEVVVRSRQGGQPTGWLMRYGRTGFVEIPSGAFVVGGGAADDLTLFGWPPAALELRLVDARLTASCNVPLSHNGQPCAPGAVITLDSGDRLAFGEDVLQVLELGLRAHEAAPTHKDLPLKVLLQPIPPAGGQVTLSSRAGEWTVFVADLRFDLLCILLQPPGPHRPNQPIPDTIIAPRVGGVPLHAEDGTLPQLYRQLRRDLELGGVDVGSVLSRNRRRTRFHLAEGATVVMLQPR